MCAILQLVSAPSNPITEGDARRNFPKKPLKVNILGVAPANFIP